MIRYIIFLSTLLGLTHMATANGLAGVGLSLDAVKAELTLSLWSQGDSFFISSYNSVVSSGLSLKSLRSLMKGMILSRNNDFKL